MTPTRRLLALALTAGVALTAAPAVPSLAAQAAPIITVTSSVDEGFPRTVPAAGSGTTTLTFSLTASEPVSGVTVKAYPEAGGLVVANPEQAVGTLSPAPVTVSFEVAGTAPGLHELTVEANSASVSGSTSLPYVWTAGSPLPTAGGDELEPTTWGWQTSTPKREVRMLTVLPGGWAYTGLLGKGTPKCKSEGGPCQRYHYSEETDVLQVGTSIIGALYGEENPPGLHTEGLASPTPGAPYGVTDSTGTSHVAGPGDSLTGTWSYGPTAGPGITFQKVTFKATGKFKLQYAVGGGKVTKLKGTFKVKKKGKITFRKKTGKVVQRGTVLVLDKTSPEHGSFTPGIWLILSGKAKGGAPDGNLLTKR